MCTKGENEQRQARWWSANLTAAPLRELIVHVRNIIGTRGQEGPELLIGQEGVVLRIQVVPEEWLKLIGPERSLRIPPLTRLMVIPSDVLIVVLGRQSQHLAHFVKQLVHYPKDWIV